MNKILLIVMGSVLVACIAVSGWFYQTNRVALGFMSAHSSLLRDSFRKTEDGLRVERVLALYKDKPNQLVNVRRNEANALNAGYLGAKFVEAFDESDSVYISWCEEMTEPPCIRYGDMVAAYAGLYNPDTHQTLYDTIVRNSRWEDSIDILRSSLNNPDAPPDPAGMGTMFVRVFELIRDEKMTIQEVHNAMDWVNSDKELQSVIVQDLFAFNVYLIDSDEAEQAVFDDADAYRAALALRDEYPQLTAFLYP